MDGPTTLARITTRDIPLSTGETLRLGLETDATGRPIHLHLALGLGRGTEWTECTEAGFAIPAADTAELVRALLPFLHGGGRKAVAR